MESELNNKINYNLKRSIIFGSFAFGFMSFILPIYTKEIGGNALSIGGLFSIFSIVTLILRPLIGRGLDIYGRKNFFASSFIFYAISMILFSYSTNTILLYASRSIQAIGSSLMWISAYSIATDISDNKEIGSSIGKVDSAYTKGSLYGSIIGFTILGNFALLNGWSIIFKVYAVSSIVAGYIAYKYIPETFQIDIEKNEKFDKKSNHNFNKLLVIVFISSVSSSMLSPLLMIYLQDRFNTNIKILALAFIPATLVYAFLPQIFGGISDKIGRIPPMIIGLVISSIVSFGFTSASSIKILIVLWVLESIGLVMSSPAEESLVSDIVNKNIRGYAYGIYLAIASLGSAIGPLIGGWLYDSFGHVLPFYINGVMLLLNAILIGVLFKNYKVVPKKST